MFAALCAIAGAARADWQYATQEDKMSSKPARYAVLESNSSLDLPFPYSGKNFGRLQIRQHPKSGLNVLVSVDKGQVLCRSYDGCKVTVRFDDAPPVSFSGTAPADHSSTTVFIENEQRFVAAAKKAKRILVQLTMYQAGNQVLEFHSSKPLEWAGK